MKRLMCWLKSHEWKENDRMLIGREMIETPQGVIPGELYIYRVERWCLRCHKLESDVIELIP